MEGEAWYEDRETVTLQNGLIDLAGVHIGIVPKLRPHSPPVRQPERVTV